MTTDPAARFLAAYCLGVAVLCLAGAYLAERRDRRRRQWPHNVTPLGPARATRAQQTRSTSR